MTKQEIIKSFGILFQDYLYKSQTSLTMINLNKWLKKEKLNKQYKITKLYTGSINIEITFKYQSIDSNETAKIYQANWILKT